VKAGPVTAGCVVSNDLWPRNSNHQMGAWVRLFPNSSNGLLPTLTRHSLPVSLRPAKTHICAHNTFQPFPPAKFSMLHLSTSPASQLLHLFPLQTPDQSASAIVTNPAISPYLHENYNLNKRVRLWRAPLTIYRESSIASDNRPNQHGDRYNPE
jgi:hypothetical protein